MTMLDRLLSGVAGQAVPRGVDNKPLVTSVLLTAAVAFVIVSATGIHKASNITGVFGALVDAVVVSVLFLVITGALAWWVQRRFADSGADAAPGQDPAADTLMAPLQAALAELEATRVDMLRLINQRSLWRVPLCAAGGLAIMQLGDEPAELFERVGGLVAGAFIGYFWASYKLEEHYRQMYKDRVLPSLCQRFGDISYRAAVKPDMQRLREEHIFRQFDSVVAEDELVGSYRGLAISIVELELSVHSGDNRSITFDGLLVEIVLPRKLVGSTAIIADGGLFGNFSDWLHKQGRERVRLEDPRFESVYQVWGDDQVAARALLTPAFMERLLALADRPWLDPPLALARDNRLTLALPKGDRVNYFEPPDALRPAASREALVQLDKDITAVLAMADTVVELDPLARSVAASPPGSSPRAA